MTSDILEDGLEEGAVGVIVAEFNEPDEAYEVEFSDVNGATITQLALTRGRFIMVG